MIKLFNSKSSDCSVFFGKREGGKEFSYIFIF